MCQLFNCLSEGAVGVNHHIVELLGVGAIRLPFPSAVGVAGDADLLASLRTRDHQHIGVGGVLVVHADVITEERAALIAHRVCLSSIGDESRSGDSGGGDELLDHGLFVWYVKIITGLKGPVNP